MNIIEQLNSPKIKEFCQENEILKLSLFGSYLKGNQNPNSDIDLLVEFDNQHIPSLLEVSRMENELSNFFGGIKVELRTPEDLSKYFRKEVIKTAKVQYARA